eukprot:scaffold12435_cov69-Phaeocystis_antarctica.AAC.4
MSPSSPLKNSLCGPKAISLASKVPVKDSLRISPLRLIALSIACEKLASLLKYSGASLRICSPRALFNLSADTSPVSVRISSTILETVSSTSLYRLLSTCSRVSALRLMEKAHSITTTVPSMRVPSTSMPVSGPKRIL